MVLIMLIWYFVMLDSPPFLPVLTHSIKVFFINEPSLTNCLFAVTQRRYNNIGRSVGKFDKKPAKYGTNKKIYKIFNFADPKFFLSTVISGAVGLWWTNSYLRMILVDLKMILVLCNNGKKVKYVTSQNMILEDVKL